jgi:hypothetical protein
MCKKRIQHASIVHSKRRSKFRKSHVQLVLHISEEALEEKGGQRARNAERSKE